MGAIWERESSGEEQGPDHPCAEQRGVPGSSPPRPSTTGTGTSTGLLERRAAPGHGKGRAGGGGRAAAAGTERLGTSPGSSCPWEKDLPKAATVGAGG